MNDLAERQDTAFNAFNAALGFILLISLWVVGYAAAELAAWNAAIGGIVLGGVAFAAFTHLREWEEWISLIVGLWVLAAP